MTISQNRHLTFKSNIGKGRHGWLRLTPAYSYNLVRQLLTDVKDGSVVLDPFAGTGTTGLVAAELGLDAYLSDINDFLVWLSRAKCSNYAREDLALADRQSEICIQIAQTYGVEKLTIPPMHRIDRWWDTRVIVDLARLMRAITESCSNSIVQDLLLVAFCRVMIAMSKATFNHQSMSLQRDSAVQQSGFELLSHTSAVFDRFHQEVKEVIESASESHQGRVTVTVEDARNIDSVSDGSIDVICTSPPYSNRMSYIRELRPYMYWLGFLINGRQAGELDWKAIGGTWGSATSRLSQWDNKADLPMKCDYRSVIEEIAAAGRPNATLLSNYVHKYFYDMHTHFSEAYRVVKSGGIVKYVVGNSTFYGNLVPTEQWYAELLATVGFRKVSIRTVRKRNSNKRLYEFTVEAVRP
ncbi:MAG: DNA methyltransferase [Chloroflexi bacterium]|nr:DNA methyltransferase [Chloroflexota bacterium]